MDHSSSQRREEQQDLTHSPGEPAAAPSMLAAAGSGLGPGVLQRKLAARLAQRRAAEAINAAEQPVPMGAPAPARTGGGAPVQRYRDYEAIKFDQRGGGGSDYKLIQQKDRHIKLHPVKETEFGGQVFNEFHVTFELFKQDNLNPKIYFNDQGKRLPTYDGTIANQNYREHHAGKNSYPTFEALIHTATEVAQSFVEGLPSYLNREQALELAKEREQQAQKRKQLAQQENELKKDLRQQSDQKHEATKFQSYSEEQRRKLFGQTGSSSQTDEKEEILALAGLKTHKEWRYIKNSLWSKPKEDWTGFEEAYEQLHKARSQWELQQQEKLKPKEEPKQEIKQEPKQEQLQEAKQIIQEKGDVGQLQQQLKGVEEKDHKDPKALTALGLPLWMIPLILVLGFYLIRMLLGG